MNDNDAFLQAILENPDDDPLRLIYADWLEERGDPRGEFIRVQCALARLPEEDPTYPDLQEREAELLAAHGAAWSAAVNKIATDSAFHRGFIERVSLGARKFLTHGAKLFALAPLRHVKLTRLGSSDVKLGSIPKKWCRCRPEALW